MKEISGVIMPQSSRQFHLKPQSLCELFSGLCSLFDKRQGGYIDDDWEYVEVLDRKISCCGEGDATSDDHDSHLGNPEEFRHISSSFPNLETVVQINYKILSKADVRQRLKDKITRVCNVLLLSRAEAAILLHKFKWSVKRTQDEWLSREEKVREAVGLFASPVVETTEIACGSCHENFPGDSMFSVSCGHQICRLCWTGYISEAINDGPGCLTLRCPNPSCHAAVGLDMIELSSSLDDKKTFERYLLTSFLNCKKKAKWCAAPGCDYAVFSSSDGDGNNVMCRCLHKFCWKCAHEAHAPVDCATVAKWMTVIGAQSETWLLANTSPCPNCKHRMQEDPDTRCLRCTRCTYEFCWVCGGAWSKHETPEFWDDIDDCDELGEEYNYEKETAQISLERYTRYYQGWAISESSRENAVVELKLFKDTLLQMLCGILNFSEKQLDFLAAAKLQIVECYRVLKWMHVYGYFLSDDEQCKGHLLKFMQEQGEELVGMLKKYVKELEDLLYGDFMEFRWKLVMLTRVTRRYYDRMVEALKAGLSDVVSIPGPSLRPNMSREERSKPKPKP